MFHQLSDEILPSLIKGRHNTNNNKAKCIPGGTLRVLAGKNEKVKFLQMFCLSTLLAWHIAIHSSRSLFFTREYTQCTAGYTFCFVVVVGAGGATFNQTWQFQLTVDETW
jgi:hypothetical protein